ncbi:hypothetical protein CLF_105992 [Clonorchis sinensis]|uniref:ZSWIM1/3 RNaseH-like domain-containing protein n=1 Tax=Clonorchis sinensis TaxID=79923 RepID=G7YEI0_CLOSI|nr:hypothetical protein CLF_105992 [Clonorchis sinensis]
MRNRCKSEIRQWNIRKQATILDLSRKNRNVLFKYMRHRRRNKPSAFSLRDRNGEPTSDPIVVSEFYRDHYAVNRRPTGDDLGTCRALLKYEKPSCEVRQFVADEFGNILTTQDIYNYRRKCRPALLSRYKLYTFLITDGMGIGRPVMYACMYVESEQFAPMRRLFGLFKETVGEQYPVRTFVMDKLAAQMRAARVMFGCDVMLCYFHIRKAIRKHTHFANSRHIFHRMAQRDNAVQFRQDLQLLRRTDPRFASYLTARLLYITRKWAVQAQFGVVHFSNVTNNRLENANGRFKDRVHHADTLEHAIHKVSRHVEWLMQEFKMHTSYQCDRRQILEGDGDVLNVVCRMTTYACSLVLRHLGPRPPRLPYDSVGTNKLLPVTAGVQRIAYHITPTVMMVKLARCAVMLFRLVLKDVESPMSTAHQGRTLSGRIYVLTKNTDKIEVFISYNLCLRLFPDTDIRNYGVTIFSTSPFCKIRILSTTTERLSGPKAIQNDLESSGNQFQLVQMQTNSGGSLKNRNRSSVLSPINPYRRTASGKQGIIKAQKQVSKPCTMRDIRSCNGNIQEIREPLDWIFETGIQRLLMHGRLLDLRF